MVSCRAGSMILPGLNSAGFDPAVLNISYTMASASLPNT